MAENNPEDMRKKEWKTLELRYVILKLEKEIDLEWLIDQLEKLRMERYCRWKDIAEILINAEK